MEDRKVLGDEGKRRKRDKRGKKMKDQIKSITEKGRRKFVEVLSSSLTDLLSNHMQKRYSLFLMPGQFTVYLMSPYTHTQWLWIFNNVFFKAVSTKYSKNLHFINKEVNHTYPK